MRSLSFCASKLGCCGLVCRSVSITSTMRKGCAKNRPSCVIYARLAFGCWIGIGWTSSELLTMPDRGPFDHEGKSKPQAIGRTARSKKVCNFPGSCARKPVGPECLEPGHGCHRQRPLRHGVERGVELGEFGDADHPGRKILVGEHETQRGLRRRTVVVA